MVDRFHSLEEIKRLLRSIVIEEQLGLIDEIIYLIDETIEQGYNIYNGKKAKSN